MNSAAQNIKNQQKRLLELLPLLICPVTKLPLALASPEQLAMFNQKLLELKTAAGQALITPMQAALISSDGKRFYPVYDGIAELLPSSGVDCQ